VLSFGIELGKPQRRKDAKGFIYFLIGTDDQKKNHALTGNKMSAN